MCEHLKMPKKYWEEVGQILFHHFDNTEFKISESLALEIMSMIKYSINGINYFLAYLIVYTKQKEHSFCKEDLINFLFYNAINKQRSYNLFIDKPDNYGTTFMFSFHPSQLPSLKKTLGEELYYNYCREINLEELFNKIKKDDGTLLMEYFPKSFNKFHYFKPELIKLKKDLKSENEFEKFKGLTFRRQLNLIKKSYPFKEWEDRIVEQYPKNFKYICQEAKNIMDKLLLDIEKGLKEEECIKRCVLAYNDLNDEYEGAIIETAEREELSSLIDMVAIAFGLEPKKYGDGDGIASEWRDW